MNKFDLVQSLTDHKALAEAKQAVLGGNNEYFQGYINALRHAIELAKIEAWRIDLGAIDHIL